MRSLVRVREWNPCIVVLFRHAKCVLTISCTERCFEISDSPPNGCHRERMYLFQMDLLSDYFIIKQPDAPVSQIYSGMNFYMFRAVPLPIIRSLFTVHSAMVYVTQALYTQLSSRTRMELQFHPGPARKLSTNLYDIYQCRMYSE